MKHEDLDRTLNRVFLEVCQGSSKTTVNERDIYIKHFSIKDQVGIDAFYKRIYDKAQKEGLPTERERLEFLNKEGTWTAESEEEIAQKENYIAGLERSLAKLVVESQQKQIKNALKDARKNLEEYIEERDGLLEGTCEKYASSKLNNFILYKSLCADPLLEVPVFSREKFGELSSMELVSWLMAYSDATKDLTVGMLKKLAISGTFANYFNLCAESPPSFFGGNVHNWTFFQVNLINYGKIFKSIFENIKNIPESIKDDPDALIEYSSQEAKRQEHQERGEK